MSLKLITSRFWSLFALLVLLIPVSAIAQSAAVTINIDANADRRAISPNIYGVAHATTAQLTDLNSPLNRNGAITRPVTTGN